MPLRLFKPLILRYSGVILSRWIVFLIDLVLLGAAIALANMLRMDFDFFEIIQFNLRYQIGMVILLGAGSLLVNNAHVGLIRHTGQVDAIRIVKAVTLTTVLLTISNYALIYIPAWDHFLQSLKIKNHNVMPNTVILIFYPLALFFLLFVRITIKLAWYNITRQGKSEKTRVMIYGAGKEGVGVLNSLMALPSSPYRVVGFLDDNPGKVGKSIQGVPIYNPAMVDNRFIEDAAVHEIIMAMPNLSVDLRNERINRLLGLGIAIKNIPPVDAWINGELNPQQIRSVRIEDLLQREPIRLGNDQVMRDIYGKKVVITGAAGSIGSELARQVLHFNPARVVFIDQAESPLFELEQELIRLENQLEARTYHRHIDMDFLVADISLDRSIMSIIREVKPHIIYHAAAYKHVPLMELNPLEAMRVNVFGTTNLADVASEVGAEKFIMISTDKAVNPTNVMGATKRLAEIYIQSLNFRAGNRTGFITTRFGNVLGSNGSVTRTFRKQIRAGGPVTVTHPEITRYFMTIPEACQLVFEAGAMGKGGEIYVFDMGQPVKIADLARNMIRLSGFVPDKDIRIVYTGLRPGEKLYEELLSDSETTLPTHHPKIMIARVRDYPFEEVTRMVDDLMFPYQALDVRGVVRQLKAIIPEYISQNSVFQSFDKVKKRGGGV